LSVAGRHSWAVRRLLAMGPAEIGLRALRGGRNRLRRPRSPVPQSSLVSAADVLERSTGARADDGSIAAELTRARCSLLVGASDRGALAGALSQIGRGPSGAVGRADAILAGRLPAFGWTEIESGEDPDWHRDPGSDRRWPLVYWADLDFRSAIGLDDPRLVWEVNRHHHLVTLARAHVLTGDDKYASAVWRHMRSWIDSNPPFYGVNWASPLEVGIRLISWALALDLVGGEGARAGDACEVLTSIALQARHVSDNLSVYASSKNNHLIGEAAGLLAVGAKFPCLCGARRWAGEGGAVLEREAAAQVTQEGVSREQSFHYGTFVLEFCVVALLSQRALGWAPGPGFRDRVSWMGEFLSSAAGPTGELPAVGDEDGGRAYELSEQGRVRQGMRAAVCAALATGREPPASARDEDLEPALWSEGPELALTDSAPGATVWSPGSGCYPEGGYFLAGRGGHHGVIDCGPLGYLSIAAHGHADCLSVSLSRGGTWLVVDPGTYCYHRQPAWRDHFRSTAAHSTVTIDGLSQSEMLGPFLWGLRARPRPLCWSRSRHFDFFEGEHDGYMEPYGVRHRRAVAFAEAGYWVVVDLLDGSGEHDVRALFQLAPGLSRTDSAGLAFEGPGARLVLERLLPSGFTVRCAEGAEHPPEGWVSRGFGLREPAPAVVSEGRCVLPAAMAFVLVPDVGPGDFELRWLSEPAPEGAGLELRHAGGTDRLLFGKWGAGSRDSFTGRFGFVAERAGCEEAVGIDVAHWSEGGADVRFSAVANLLRKNVGGRKRSHT
jgi:hypothetical protein